MFWNTVKVWQRRRTDWRNIAITLIESSGVFSPLGVLPRKHLARTRGLLTPQVRGRGRQISVRHRPLFLYPTTGDQAASANSELGDVPAGVSMQYFQGTGIQSLEGQQTGVSFLRLSLDRKSLSQRHDHLL